MLGCEDAPTPSPAADLRVRDARSRDARAVSRLLQQLGYPSSPEAVTRRVRLLRSSRADRIVVAELDREVVGLAVLHTSLSVEHDEPAAKVSAIVVDEQHRRRGIGEALISELEAEARRRGCCLIFLTTAGRRKDAHAFYRRIGFEETGKRFAKWLR
jgi:ribosomal protein S18 acetylase RimI-like enzyme